MKVVKKFDVDFYSGGGALTLRDSYVSDISDFIGLSTRFHEDSGWTITGEIVEDYYTWVNEFKATHEWYGTVKGNFEKKVTASSEEAFEHFWKHHEPEAWDYQDI